MGQPTLKGVLAKLDRGDQNTERFKLALERFLDERPYRIISEEDPKTGECLVKAQVTNEPPVYSWGALLGEILFDYRSALDQLAWQLALVNNPNVDPPDRTEFPIFKDPTKFERKRKSKIGGLGWEAQYLVCECQPCYRRDRPQFDWLWSLHELNRTDKHRTLHLVGHQASAVAFWINTIRKLGIAEDRLAPVGAFKDGEVISRLPPMPEPSKLAEHLRFTYGVAFDKEGPAARGVRVDLALDQWRKVLRNEVLPKFRKFFGS